MNLPPYLQSPDDSLWRINVSEDLIEWSSPSEGDSKMIVFGSELELILRQLSSVFQGLPELTIVLFLIASLRRDVDLRWLSARLIECGSKAGVVTPREQSNDSGFDTAVRKKIVAGLERLNLHRPGESRNIGEVIKTLFRSQLALYIVVDKQEATEAIDWLAKNPFERSIDDEEADVARIEQPAHSRGSQPRRLYRTFTCMTRILASPLTTDQAEMRLETGIDEIPEAVQVENGHCERYGAIIDRLLSDDELSEVAQFARQICSVLSLPLAPSDPSELPIGGVSDISNKGNPERLLATELAADPMLLLARIATGQALYLRRESPPESGVRARQILIESSVRTWGQTRVLALSIGLGLAAAEQDRSKSEVSIGTLAGDEFVEEDLLSRRGIIDHLSRLHAVAHPGLGLLRWAGRGLDAQSKELPVLVLSESTWKDRDFRGCLQELQRDWLVATIDSQGHLRLFRYDRGGEHPLRRMRLGASRLPSVISTPNDPRPIPTFVKLRNATLRFGTNATPNWCVAGQHAFWVQTSDERLLCFDKHGKGGRSVLDRFSVSSVSAHRCSGKKLELVARLPDGHRYVVIDASEGVVANHSIVDLSEGSFFFDLGSLFHQSAKTLTLIDKGSGRKLDSKSVQGIRVAGVPFRHDPIIGLEVYYQAGHRIESHSYADLKITPPAIGFRDADDVPTFLSTDLKWIRRPCDLSPSESLQANGLPPIQMTHVVALSSDSRRVIVAGRTLRMGSIDHNEAVQVMVDLENKTTSRVYLSENPMRSLSDLGEPLALGFRQVNLVSRLVGAGIDQKGLFLRASRSRRVMRLKMVQPGHLQLTREPAEPTGCEATFGDVIYHEPVSSKVFGPAGNSRTRWKLRDIVFGDSTLWLDSRGLLHLSMRGDSRQLSVVLDSDGPTGWFSDGTWCWGNDYYSIDGYTASGSTNAAQNWFEDWLRSTKWWQK